MKFALVGATGVVVNLGVFLGIALVGLAFSFHLVRPLGRLREEARERGKLVDATEGRRTRSILVTDSDHVILSAVQVETLLPRFSERGEE